MKIIEQRLESISQDLDLCYRDLQRWRDRPHCSLKNKMLRSTNEEIIYLERKRSRLQAKLHTQSH